jgi:primosomal protein N' (replication factor Y)
VGYILKTSEEAPDIKGIKDISAVIPDACPLTPELMSLASWVSTHYTSPLSHSVRAIVPEAMSATVCSVVRLAAAENASNVSPAQLKIVRILGEMGGEADTDILKARCNTDKFAATVRQLKNRGAVDVTRILEMPKVRPLTVQGLQITDPDDIPDADLSRAPKQSAILKELAKSGGAVRRAELLAKAGSSSGPARTLVEKGLAEKVRIRVRRKPFKDRPIEAPREFTLTRGQEDALAVILEGLESGTPQTTLIWGVTGSGKTEIYLRSIAHVLEAGGRAISLCPEISLTAHLMDAYRARFGDSVAILHSKLSVGERYDEWRRIESGEASVVLGPRSAIFAPVRNLKLIIVDEEHEPSYKQDHSPRYNARLAAEARARAEGASVVLGSATPSLETFCRASSGEIRLATLRSRVDDRPMPRVQVVDLREEWAQGRKNIFSRELQEAMEDRLAKGEQTILFVNRRGYSSFLLCRTCGYTPKCENCDVSLSYHAGTRTLQCHHCNESHPAPTACPSCGGPHIRGFGTGTERVEEEVLKLFPDVPVIRMDSDTTSRKGAHARLLDEFKEGRASILVGTQMVAKGLDFPNVTLVGVISADTALNLPDFRAAERTFQLLTQVSGRAGRGTIPGDVVVQTFAPDNFAIRAAAKQDYMEFYNQEIANRQELFYPPFSRLISVISADPVNDYARDRLAAFAESVREKSSGVIKMLGPSPAPITRLKGLYRWHLLIKDDETFALRDMVRDVYEGIPPQSRTGLVIDVDPISML